MSVGSGYTDPKSGVFHPYRNPDRQLLEPVAARKATLLDVATDELLGLTRVDLASHQDLREAFWRMREAADRVLATETP